MFNNSIMNVLVLGNFGYATDKLDGQTIKTRNIYEMLFSKDIGNVFYFDTSDLKHNKLLVLKLFKKLCTCNRLVYLPAHGNLKYLFPIIFLWSLLFRYRIIYIVIGGWLTRYLQNMPLHRFLLKRVELICVETNLMKCDLLQMYSISNVLVLPNFRKTDIFSVDRDSLPILSNNKLNIVFMARIQIEKGLDYIEEVCRYVCKNNLDANILIDFYGQIDEKDEIYFSKLLETYGSFIRYQGALSPQKIRGILAQYDILLLLTHYYTEGFPGTILDAYMAGIPVIVTKWKYATEFVEHGVTGFIVPFEDGINDVIKIISSLLVDKSILESMKKAAKNKALDYSEDKIWSNISNYFLG